MPVKTLLWQFLKILLTETYVALTLTRGKGKGVLNRSISVEECQEVLVFQSEAVSPYIHTHTHTVLTAIFPGEPGLAGCPLNSPSPFIPGLYILFGTGLNFPCHS